MCLCLCTTEIQAENTLSPPQPFSLPFPFARCSYIYQINTANPLAARA